MKNLLYIFILIFLFSCSTQKNIAENYTETYSDTNNLTTIESNIVNQFLSAELEKERYKNYKGYDIFVIKEAIKKNKSIDAYLYSFNDWKSMNKIDKKGDLENKFFLDSMRIKKIKHELEKEEVYHWKISDFKNKKVSLYKYEELMTIINSGAYTNLQKRLIIFLSKPLIINENNALVCFNIGNGELGNSAITHFTVLMEKINGNWKDKAHYHDGVFY